MSDEQVPAWLQAAVTRIPTRQIEFPENADWPLEARPGEIRAARSMDAESAGTRLMLVLETYTEADPWINACLIAEAVEVATDKDLRLEPSDTDLPFPVLVESDVVGPLFMVQLGPLLGQIDASLLDDLKAAVYGEWISTLGDRRGMPIIARDDARWRLKEDEIAAMHALAHACMEHLMMADGKQGTTDVVLDPGFLSSEPVSPVPTLLNLLVVVDKEQIRLDVPTEGLARTGELPEWTASLSPDEARALEPVWQGCLRAERQTERGERDTHWSAGWSASSDETLTRHLARRATGGTRAFRVLTSRSHWPGSTSGGVVALEIEGMGRIQVKPELVEAEA
jgi:hypothetical protein